jgi:hypothetical protein
MILKDLVYRVCYHPSTWKGSVAWQTRSFLRSGLTYEALLSMSLGGGRPAHVTNGRGHKYTVRTRNLIRYLYTSMGDLNEVVNDI